MRLLYKHFFKHNTAKQNKIKRIVEQHSMLASFLQKVRYDQTKNMCMSVFVAKACSQSALFITLNSKKANQTLSSTATS